MPPTLWAYGFIVSTNCPGRTIVAESRVPVAAGAPLVDGAPPGAAGAGAQASRKLPDRPRATAPPRLPRNTARRVRRIIGAAPPSGSWQQHLERPARQRRNLERTRTHHRSADAARTLNSHARPGD